MIISKGFARPPPTPGHPSQAMDTQQLPVNHDPSVPYSHDMYSQQAVSSTYSTATATPMISTDPSGMPASSDAVVSSTGVPVTDVTSNPVCMPHYVSEQVLVM